MFGVEDEDEGRGRRTNQISGFGIPALFDFAADILSGLRPAQGFGRAGHFLEFFGAEQLLQPVGDVLKAVDFGGGAVFEQKIAVSRLLPGMGL